MRTKEMGFAYSKMAGGEIVIFILGANGYIGSSYVRLAESLNIPCQAITRANYDQFIGKSCDVLINANGNSKKFLADRDPKWEFDASVRSVVHSVEDFPSDLYIYLSSGDVYPDQSTPAVSREDQILAVDKQSKYGFHKHLAEQVVRSTRPRHLIMRMGGFVGPGMKKNAIFDLLQNSPVWVSADSELQFISTDAAARIVWSVVELGHYGETVNLGATGVVKISDLHSRINSKSVFQPNAQTVRFEISTEKLSRLCQRSLPTTAQEVESYLVSIGR